MAFVTEVNARVCDQTTSIWDQLDAGSRYRRDDGTRGLFFLDARGAKEQSVHHGGRSTMIRAVIAHDQVLARLKLRQALKDISGVEIVGECATATDIVELARLVNPQLIILDVHMRDVSAFDVVERLSSEADQSRAHVIFVADTDEYAVRAFEVRAVDYLLEPFTRERLENAVLRVRERISKDEPDQDDTQKPEQQEFPSRFVIKSRGKILFLPVAEIRWIKAQENYVKIFTGSESHLLREPISSVENRLDSRLFLRIHRSVIVNLLHVKEVRNETKRDATVVLKNGQKVPMSRKYRSILDTLIKAQ